MKTVIGELPVSRSGWKVLEDMINDRLD
jgi:hypothetical protein